MDFLQNTDKQIYLKIQVSEYPTTMVSKILEKTTEWEHFIKVSMGIQEA